MINMESSNWNERLSQLERKWVNGTITGPEAIEFDSWYNQGQEEIVVIPYSFAASEEEHRSRIFQKINKGIERRSCFRIGRVAAAAVLLIIFGGMLFYRSAQMRQDEMPIAGSEGQGTAILPGSTKASLRLANGQIVPLDSAADRLVAQQGSVNIRMWHGGLAYEKQGHGGSMTYNTLITHNGEQYSLVLSDGTKVWLNSASSLYFPVAFDGRERRVEVSGEAYFEVAKDPGKPFYVASNGQEIEVLGTHFNVKAYPNGGAVETTLLQGKVRVNGKFALSPGQQAQLKNGTVSVKDKVNVNAVIAWKDGRFNFDNADVSEVLRQLERWYDIQVVLPAGRTSDHFSGTIPRSASFDQVLRILQNNRVHFDLQGRRLVLLP
jgi:transmembrane sensor